MSPSSSVDLSANSRMSIGGRCVVLNAVRTDGGETSAFLRLKPICFDVLTHYDGSQRDDCDCVSAYQASPTGWGKKS